MNAKSLAPFLLANTTVVIDINGEVRELLPGEVPGPGEVIVIVGQGATANNEVGIEAELVGEGGDNLGLDLDGEIAAIISQIEEGVDPTQNEDFATAAGGEQGSSLTGSGDIARTGDETIAETLFETAGLESQGLSETQSLALLDFIAQTVFVGDDSIQAFETDVPLLLNGSIEAQDTATPTFVAQDSVEGDYGTFFLNEDGTWTYAANSAFNELNVGDSLVDVFPIQSADGTVGSVTVTINGTNDLPTFVGTDTFSPGGEGELSNFAFEDGVYTFDLPENTLEGVTIGQVAATDVDNAVLEFSISQNLQNEGGEDLFAIDPDTGEISLTAAGAASYVNDFELLENQHLIVVTVTEVDGLGEPQSVDVDVIFNEQNENEPPIFEPPQGGGDDYLLTYPENSSTETALGTVTADDLDANDSVTYSITTNVEVDGLPLFRIDESSGTIYLTDKGVEVFSNDFETEPNLHNIVVTATDSGGLTASIDVTLEESDVNEAPTSDEPEGGYLFEYEENSDTSTLLGTVSASDVDANDTLTYSITTNVEVDGLPLYRIDSTSGEIYLTDKGEEVFTNDYETDPNMHDIVVTATDSGGLTATINVTLKETDVNEAPTSDEPDGGYLFEYAENSDTTTLLGTVSATDVDDGDTLTYSITSNVEVDGLPLYRIDATSGEIYLTDKGEEVFTNDYETDPNMHDIVVTATDSGGLTATINVTLKETDVNEAPTSDEPDGGYLFEYAENSDTTTLLGTVSATDVDDGDTLTYSITTNVEVDGLPLYRIDETSGEIYLTDKGEEVFTNDYETDPNMHDIVVTATDSGGLTATINVTLKETDVNEAPTSDEPDGGYLFEYAENSDTTALLGTVSATDVDDGDTLTYSITTNVEVDGLPLYRIDETSGEIYLTAKGEEVFTNDFETDPNMHDIVVTATDSGGLTATINVTLKETDVNEAPTSDEPEGGYVFEYPENSTTSTLLGTVSATDVDDGDSVTYSITSNVEVDGLPLYRVDESSGQIYLTDKGVDVFTNDFESDPNMHSITITATDTGGLTGTINVTLKETDVMEPPQAESFDVDAGDATFVPIIFDSDDPSLDRISDEDDDASGDQVLVMITSLPENGTLLYIEDGVSRVITEDDLLSVDDYDPTDPDNLDKMFIPNNIVFVPGPGDEFEMGTSGDPDDIMLVDGFDNWGEYVSDIERLVTLENSNTITISYVDQNPNGSPNAKLKQYEGNKPHVGHGIADNQGNGLQPGEKIIVDLRNNPLSVVNFGLDGLGGNFAKGSVVLVTYVLESGATVTEEYSKDPDDRGNANIYYEFSYSSPSDPVVEMTFNSTGGSYEIRYISGNEDIVEDVTFDYVAVDSDLMISEEETVSIDVSASPEYEVVEADETGQVDADIGNQVMLGDESANIFTWLDSTLDNGVDVIDNFSLEELDKVDLRGILEEDDNVEIGDLMAIVDTALDGDDVVLTVSDEGVDQTIVLEGVRESFEDAGFIAAGSIVDELDMLTTVLKTDAA